MAVAKMQAISSTKSLLLRRIAIAVMFVTSALYGKPGIISQDLAPELKPGPVGEDPPLLDYEIVTTNYGWTTPARKNFSSHIVTSEFFQSVQSHPRYNSSAWQDLEERPDPNRKVVAFLDVDTCFELNYPTYLGGRRDWWVNYDMNHLVTGGRTDFLHESCKYIDRALHSPALLSNPASRLVLLDCSGNEGYNLRRVCGPKANFSSGQLVVAYTSIRKSVAREADIGLPPPAIKPVYLSPIQKYLLRTCRDEGRRYLFSFQGDGGLQSPKRFNRHQLMELKGEDVFVQVQSRSKYIADAKADGTAGDSMNFTSILQQSVFAAAPRGDNLFSYRFAEILSAGELPTQARVYMKM